MNTIEITSLGLISTKIQPKKNLEIKNNLKFTEDSLIFIFFISTIALFFYFISFYLGINEFFWDFYFIFC